MSPQLRRPWVSFAFFVLNAAMLGLCLWTKVHFRRPVNWLFVATLVWASFAAVVSLVSFIALRRAQRVR